MVFDREGYGCEFFHTLLENQLCFVTWEKYIDTHKLDAFTPEMFTDSFEFNAKMYRIFEGERRPLPTNLKMAVRKNLH